MVYISFIIASPCTGKPDGFYVADDLCLAYYQCSSGIMTEHTCDKDGAKYFNNVTRRCQNELPHRCKGKNACSDY